MWHHVAGRIRWTSADLFQPLLNFDPEINLNRAEPVSRTGAVRSEQLGSMNGSSMAVWAGPRGGGGASAVLVCRSSIRCSGALTWMCSGVWGRFRVTAERAGRPGGRHTATGSLRLPEGPNAEYRGQEWQGPQSYQYSSDKEACHNKSINHMVN